MRYLVFLFLFTITGTNPSLSQSSGNTETLARNYLLSRVDIQVPIDFRVEDTDANGRKKISSKAKDDFSNCIGEPAKSEKKK